MPKITLEAYANQYITTLLDVAKSLGNQSLMGQATLKRVETVLDLIEAWQRYEKT